jgi:N-acetylneuraminic acid mutarotase
MIIKTHLFIIVSLISLVSCNELLVSPYPEIVLTKVETVAVSARANASSLVIDGKAYILFGRPEIYETVAFNDCWQFTPETKDWVRKVDFPGVGRVGAIAEVVNGKAFVGFGYRGDGGGVYGSDSTILSDFWMYNSLLDTWERKADFPRTAYDNKPPLNSCSSFTYQKWIYIIGLYNGKSYPNEVWRYNTENDQWERMNDFKGSARSAAVACTDNTFYYFGLGYNRTYRSDWWQYFPATDTWKEMASIPGKGRVNATAFVVDNRFFVAGGHYISGTLTGNKYFDEILEYDRAANKWYRIGQIPTGGRENALSFVLNHKAYLAFGESQKEVYNDLWFFTP